MPAQKPGDKGPWDHLKDSQDCSEPASGEKAIYWLLKLRIATRRQGWEDGPTEDEVWGNIVSFLFNLGLDDGGPREQQESVQQILEEMDQLPIGYRV